MKYLILLLFCFPAWAHENDKLLHATTSAAITATTYAKLRDAGASKTASLITAAAVSFSAGALKEFVYDEKADPNDLSANMAGIGLTVLVISF